MEKIIDGPLFFTLALVVFGTIAFVVIWWFGTQLVRSRAVVVDDAQLEKLIAFYQATNQSTNPLWHLVNLNADHVQRRNEFWQTYVQTTAAVLIVIVIAVLLLAKAIEADAGLPILSAISGFVIAKSVTPGRTGGDQERRG
jgi:hypothetical protein